MLRYVGPFLFFCVAGYVTWYNLGSTPADGYLTLPLVGSLPGVDPADGLTQGWISVGLLVVLGVIWLAIEIILHVRRIRSQEGP